MGHDYQSAEQVEHSVQDELGDLVVRTRTLGDAQHPSCMYADLRMTDDMRDVADTVVHRKRLRTLLSDHGIIVTGIQVNQDGSPDHTTARVWFADVRDAME